MDNPHGSNIRARAFRAAALLTLAAVVGLMPGCGGNDGSGAAPTPSNAPTFANGGINQEPRLFPTQTVDSSFNSITSQTSFNFEIECTVVVPDVPTWRGQVIVRKGDPPLTYTMANAPLGMTINSATGELTYLAPNCTESGTSKTTTFTVTDAGGKVTSPPMRQVFVIIVRN